MNLEGVILENDNRFKQLIKNSFDMVVLMDSVGNQYFVSASCEKILGFKQEELMGISVIEKMIHPEDQESAKKDFLDIIENKTNGGVQYRHLHKNGTWVYLETFGTNQLDNPVINAVVLNVRDITERKQAEKIIKETQTHLKEVIASKDKLFSIIAHDLRSPFNAILGYSELLIESTKDVQDGECDGYVAIINSSAKNTLILLDNLLNWAKSQTGQISCKPEKIDISVIIKGILKTANSTAKIKKISLNYVQSDVVELYTDVNMFKIVLRNLISNGIKFTHPNGKIEVLVRQHKKHIEITVADNGIGMDEETTNKLFKINTNISTKGTAAEKGSGLGLLLCKEFVEKQNGRIWVNSVVGKGSDFVFTLPLRTAPDID